VLMVLFIGGVINAMLFPVLVINENYPFILLFKG